MPDIFQEVKMFKGIKNDEDIKEIPIDFLAKATNINFPDIGLQGLEKILMPERVNDLGTGNVDGEYEYRYLDSNNKIKTEHIGICDGVIYKNILSTPVAIKTGLTTGKCSFTVLNDQLYIANGKDYVYVYDGAKGIVSQMGAPIAVSNGLGVLNGAYYWAMTYVTAGGEEILGSVSNTLNFTNGKATLNLPIGYSGTTSRKIYRTASGGSTLKLLTTINDNTTLTYSDNTLDSALGAQIAAVNNELPKPYFIATFNERLIGWKVDIYPTQIFYTDTEISVFDLATGLDIANYSDDNTAIQGGGIDFSSLMIGTSRHIYLVDVETPSVTVTRVNTGIKDGYSVKRALAYGSFPGGLMFVSTNNDVRLLTGLRAIPVATSVDNISSEDFAQNIRGTLQPALNSANNIYAEFYNYRYHLIIDGDKYVFDTRTNGWTYHNIQTTSYKSTPVVLAELNGLLYNGQNDGWVEQEYKSINYRSEDVEAIIESPNIFVSNKYKAIQNFIFWLLPSENNDLNIQVIADDDKYLSESLDFDLESGAYAESDFDSSEFEIADELDYRVYNVHKNVRWIRFVLKITSGNIVFNSWAVTAQLMSGKE